MTERFQKSVNLKFNPRCLWSDSANICGKTDPRLAVKPERNRAKQIAEAEFIRLGVNAHTPAIQTQVSAWWFPTQQDEPYLDGTTKRPPAHA